MTIVCPLSFIATLPFRKFLNCKGSILDLNDRHSLIRLSKRCNSLTMVPFLKQGLILLH